VLDTWYPGQEGGTALAQILFGDYSPSGKLPASFERRWEDNPTFHSYYPEPGQNRVKYSEGIFLGYRYFDRSETKPLFAFGHGLSYTTFGYSKLAVTPPTGNLSEPITVSFDVKNTGKREAAEVAQLYVGDSHASVPRPVKELKAFAKVNLKPGETRRVTLTLDRRAFSFYDVKKKDWSAEPGDFTILVGGASDDIQLRGWPMLRIISN
jgi:beta-glucosidase